MPRSTELTDKEIAISCHARRQREIVCHHLSSDLCKWLKKHVPIAKSRLLGRTQSVKPEPADDLCDLRRELSDELLKLLAHQEMKVAMAAVWELGHLGGCPLDEDQMRRLTEFLSNERNRVRTCAALTIGQMPASAVDQDAAGRLLELLKDPWSDVRASAVRAVGHVLPGKALSLVERLRDDESELVRLAAARVLGRLTEMTPPAEMVQQLQDSASYDPSLKVRSAAGESLELIGAVLMEEPSPRRGCLKIADIGAALESSWTPDALRHVQSCQACRRDVTYFWKNECPSLWSVLLYARPGEALADSFDLHIDRDKCGRCRRLREFTSTRIELWPYLFPNWEAKSRKIVCHLAKLPPDTRGTELSVVAYSADESVIVEAAGLKPDGFSLRVRSNRMTAQTAIDFLFIQDHRVVDSGSLELTKEKSGSYGEGLNVWRGADAQRLRQAFGEGCIILVGSLKAPQWPHGSHKRTAVASDRLSGHGQNPESVEELSSHGERSFTTRNPAETVTLMNANMHGIHAIGAVEASGRLHLTDHVLHDAATFPAFEQDHIAVMAEQHHGEQTYEELKSNPPFVFEQALGHLKELVRIGVSSPMDGQRWQSDSLETLTRLQDHVRVNPSVPERDRLYIANLGAEFYDRIGDFHQAERILADMVGNAITRSPEDYLNRQIKSQVDDGTLKQRVWWFLNYVWVVFYRAGRFTAARDLLEEAYRHMNRARREHMRAWHGTESRWQYYYAHALRGLRNFDTADVHFTRSTRHALERLRCRIGETPGAEFESRWAIVWNARVQGCGHGWILLQEGKLTKAFRALLQAQVQLEYHGDSFLKLFNESLLHTASLRLALPGEDSHGIATDQLLACALKYRSLGDLRGELRCRQEVCRGLLDVSEFAEDRTKARHAKEQAEIAMKELHDRLPANDRRWRMRYDLLRARFAITALGDAPEVQRSNCLPLARLACEMRSHLEHDPANGDIIVMAGLLAWMLGDYPIAQQHFQSVEERAGEADPVLRLEAQLLLVWCATAEILALRKKNERSTEKSERLARVQGERNNCWARILTSGATDIENGYLKALSRRVEKSIQSEMDNTLDALDLGPPPAGSSSLTVRCREDLPRGPLAMETR